MSHDWMELDHTPWHHWCRRCGVLRTSSNGGWQPRYREPSADGAKSYLDIGVEPACKPVGER